MIAVIGGAGYIGSHTVNYLVEKGREVVVFANLSTGHAEFVPTQVPFIKREISIQRRIYKHYFRSIQTSQPSFISLHLLTFESLFKNRKNIIKTM
ncbi:UDP-glucose 4-epimerase [Sporosarcina luteola]|nr:UDP-glucose 4-epimerase [Sporosarcina luteola]